MSWIANLVYALGAVIYAPFLLYQMVFQKKNRRGWREKLTGPKIRLDKTKPARPIWVHGVSLGEINAAQQLIRLLQQRFGDRPVVISSTTDTGFARARALYGDDRVFRYPLDFTGSVHNALKRIDPAVILLMELEVWYNMVTDAQSRGIPVAVVNGRLTARSCRRLQRLGPIARRMFGSLRWVGAQDELIARRFASLGVPQDRLTVTGSMKWDTAQVADHIEGQESLAEEMGINPDQPLWVCGSTGPGEETILLDAYEQLLSGHPDLQLAIIPRKPERFEEVDQLIRKRGFTCIRRSRSPQDKNLDQSTGGEPESRPKIFLGDTMGELRKFYALATVVFVGRSLVPMGGSDPMEVAALAKPIITGPHMENFQLPIDRLKENDAVEVVASSDGLTKAVEKIINDPQRAERLGRNAQKVVLDNQGATATTVEKIAELAGQRVPHSSRSLKATKEGA